MLNILASVVASALIVVSALNAPAGIFSVNQYLNKSFGALTNISTATNIADFPAIYNANLLQTVDSASTTLPAITTLANLSTIGTIVSGVWNGTAIGVGYGGTGTTSPTLNQVMIGNGSSGFKVIGFGTSGQFLTSGGAGAAPSWTTSSVDQAGTYNWTGLHTFLNSSSTRFSAGQAWFGGTATSTFGTDGSLTLGGALDINDKTLTGFASSTIFIADASWTKPSFLTASSTIVIEVVGGGGGGGGVNSGSCTGCWGGAGGGGAYHKFVYLAGELPSSLFIEVGDGGTGGSGTSAGGSGGASCVSTSASCGGTIYARAFGGGGGSAATGGNSGAGGGGGGVLSVGADGSGTTPGNGGSPAGGNSTFSDSSFGGGRGGGSDSAFGGGGGGTNGTGGDSVYGAGGGGNPNANDCSWQVGGTSVFAGAGATGSGVNVNGTNGNIPGGGATGGCNGTASSGARTGGNGARGEVRITTYR